MAWKINFTTSAYKQVQKLDKQVAKKIIKFIQDMSLNENPRISGKALKGNLSELWRYRVGDFRIICTFENDKMNIIVVKVGHRKDVYDS